MPRTKKVSEEFKDADLAGLQEGEKVVLTKTFEKKTIPADSEKKDPETIVIDVETVDDDDDENPYPIGSAAHSIWEHDNRKDDDQRDLENVQLTVIVKRKADSMGDKFRIPCSTLQSYPPIRNIDPYTSEMDIEELVRQNHGGGHYSLQYKIGNDFSRMWQVSLADPIESEQRPAVSIATEPPRAPAEKPLSLMETIELADTIKNKLFGAESKRLEQAEKDLAAANEKIRTLELGAMEARLKSEIDAIRNEQPQDELSQKLKAAEGVKDDSLKKQILGNIFPDASKRGILDQFFDHKTEFFEIIDFGKSLIAGKSPASELDEMFKPTQQQPENLPQSDFVRQSQTDTTQTGGK